MPTPPRSELEELKARAAERKYACTHRVSELGIQGVMEAGNQAMNDLDRAITIAERTAESYEERLRSVEKRRQKAEAEVTELRRIRDEARAAVLALRDVLQRVPGTQGSATAVRMLADTESYEQFRES